MERRRLVDPTYSDPEEAVADWLMDGAEKYCDTYSVPTEEHPLRSPTQTDKFMDKCKKFLVKNGIDPESCEITIYESGKKD